MTREDIWFVAATGSEDAREVSRAAEQMLRDIPHQIRWQFGGKNGSAGSGGGPVRPGSASRSISNTAPSTSWMVRHGASGRTAWPRYSITFRTMTYSYLILLSSNGKDDRFFRGRLLKTKSA